MAVGRLKNLILTQTMFVRLYGRLLSQKCKMNELIKHHKNRKCGLENTKLGVFLQAVKIDDFLMKEQTR